MNKNEALASKNFNAYSAIESLESFKTEKEILEYRERRIHRYSDHAQFILDQLGRQNDIKILEVGSGSSGLLFNLNDQCSNFKAIGVEYSPSRWRFAEKWKADSKAHGITNLNNDFSKIKYSQKDLDAYIVIDNTFSYLYPENKNYPDILLKQAHDHLKPNGFILIDVINYHDRIKKGNEKIWSQFPNSDPFKYGLYSFELLKDNMLITKSIFINRNLEEEIKEDVSYIYTIDNLNQLLKKNNFVMKGIYGDFQNSKFNENKSKRLIIKAIKE